LVRSGEIQERVRTGRLTSDDLRKTDDGMALTQMESVPYNEGNRGPRCGIYRQRCQGNTGVHFGAGWNREADLAAVGGPLADRVGGDLDRITVLRRYGR